MIYLSIIVAVYNTEEYLRRCLDSLVTQDIPPEEYEIIVINDGTTDNSPQIVREYLEKYPQIRFYEQENKGLFETRNEGVRFANGQYVSFVDSDDYLAANSLGRIVDFIKQHDLDVFGYGIEETTHTSIPTPKLTQATFENLEIYDGPGYISKFDFRKESVWFMVKKEMLTSKEITFIEGPPFSDGPYTAEVLYHARKVSVIPQKLYAYYQRENSILRDTNPEHSRQLLNRYEATSRVFRTLIDEIEQKNNLSETGLARLRSKEVSYIFFMLIRTVKSNLSWSEVNAKLNELKSEGYYPIKDFINEDYDALRYRGLLFILNRKPLFYLSIAAFRGLSRVWRFIAKTA